jgi:hypothetical protein
MKEVLSMQDHQGGLVRTVAAAHSTKPMDLEGSRRTLTECSRETNVDWVRGEMAGQKRVE